MRRSHPLRRNLIRKQLAYQAAKLMAEGGITDHAAAKLKAARQLGADSKHLPDNQEIDEALLRHRALFQQDSHPHILARLRKEALATMRLLAPFCPYLTGSVLSGTANEHSDINLTLFSDNAKAVLLFLLRQGLVFKEGEWRIRLHGREGNVPSYTLTAPSGVQIHLIVLPESAHHSGVRRPDTHADIAAVEALLSG